MIGVSVVIPTFNERENITLILERSLEALEDYNVEFIVVDDDSPDRTWEIVEERYRDDPRVRVLRRRDDRGLATAVSDGFQAASKKYCAVIDADLQHPPEKLPQLLQELDEGADVAIGSRHVDGGGIENWSRTRKLVSWGATNVARASIPAARRISDPMSGFFAIRREIVEDVSLDPKGYKILLELLAKCEYQHVAEVPYVFRERERGESKLTATEYKCFVEHIIMLAAIHFGPTEKMNPARVVRAAEFAAVGAVGVLVNMAVFLLVYTNGIHHLVAGAGAFLVAVNTNFVGNWAITFDRPQTDMLYMWSKFHGVSLVGFLMYSIVLAVSIDVMVLPALVGNGIAIAGSSVLNFLGSESFAFDNTTEEEIAHSSSSLKASD